MTQRRFAQRWHQALVLHGLQKPLMDSAEVLRALLRLIQAQMQVGQVVMGNDTHGHRFIGVMPALEQHLGQGQGLQIQLAGIDQLALVEQAIGNFGGAFPVLHDKPPGRYQIPPAVSFSGSSSTSSWLRGKSVCSRATSMIGRPCL
ncbi:hypothetical protein D3C75_788930 [compost metagenome]